MKLANQFMIASATALGLGLMTAYAQPKPGPADKKPATPAAEACPCASAGQCPPGCRCGPCAMASDAGVACRGEACGHAGMDCPMANLSGLADLKLEKTKSGAVIQLTAKDAAKVAEVQALAAKMAEHMKSGGCCPMMHGGHGHPHGHAPGAGPGAGRGRPMTPPAK